MKRGHDEERWVRPDGLAIRRIRRDRGWSRRDLVDAIGEAALRATGIRETISQNLLEAIEEENEAIPYATLCRIAAGLDREPIELVSEAP